VTTRRSQSILSLATIAIARPVATVSKCLCTDCIRIEMPSLPAGAEHLNIIMVVSNKSCTQLEWRHNWYRCHFEVTGSGTHVAMRIAQWAHSQAPPEHRKHALHDCCSDCIQHKLSLLSLSWRRGAVLLPAGQCARACEQMHFHGSLHLKLCPSHASARD